MGNDVSQMSTTLSEYVPSFSSSNGASTAASSTAGAEALNAEEYRRRGISKMDNTMRAKYGQGTTYNFKLVIRGDMSVGKSTLLRRLRGGNFIAEYEQTREIKTAHVSWRAKSCPEDNVALEVWDVVDRAPKRAVSENLTLAASAQSATPGQHTFPLDATVVDVYRGAHACVVLVDPSKRWTFEYAMRELQKVPLHIPTALVLNFRDYPEEKRGVTRDEAEEAVEDKFGDRPFKPFVLEISLLNCFGLGALSTFLHVPFLCLKRATLEQALTLNTTAIVQAQEALEAVKGASYEAYTQKLGLDQQSKEPSPEDAATTAKADEKAADESSLSWNKLRNMTVGEIPLVVAGAALKSTASTIATVASKTPAELSQDLANNLRNFASLGGGASSVPKDDKAVDSTPLPPQFSHLGPGGVERAAFGGKDIADEDKAAIEAMVQKKGAGNDHWLSDGEDGDDADTDGFVDDDDDDRGVSVKMDGWDDEDDEEVVDEDDDEPVHFIRQISKDDPFFGASKDKTKNGSAGKPPKPPRGDLDPERLAAAFNGTSASKDEYEKVEDPLGLALARTASISPSTSGGALKLADSGSDKKSSKKDKSKKEKKSKKDKEKSGSSASKSKKKDWMKDWDESD